MALFSLILSLLSFFTVVLALPSHTSEVSNVRRRCGPVTQFYGQTDLDWRIHGTDKWLDEWVFKHPKIIANNPAGFAGAWGQWAFGNPDWSCRDDGSSSVRYMMLVNLSLLRG